MYKIEDDVPIPKGNSGRPASEIANTALSLKVGQSFVCDKPQADVHACLRIAKRNGMKFKTKRETETTTRIWRIA